MTSPNPTLEALVEAARDLIQDIIGDIEDGTAGQPEKNLHDALARYDAAASETEGGWRPIETAPKEEGARILACRAGSVIPFVTNWDEDFGWFTFNGWYETMRRRSEPEWRWEPTHWMPLPAPPSPESPDA